MKPATEPLLPWLVLGGLTSLLVWGYWNSLSEASLYWIRPQYSHGYLVPLFTLVLLWMRRQPLSEVKPVERWWGVGLLAVGLGLRLLAAQSALDIPDMVTFVPSLGGIVLLAGGVRMLRWAGPAVGFLIFMFPLPWTLEQALLAPLQAQATRASTYALQTLGIGAYHIGNRISIGDLEMGVVDACSGLRMTTIFLALSVAIVLVTDRPWWERVIVLLSAIPIALVVNVTRITVTGVFYVTVGEEWVDAYLHDFFGYAMMFMALILLFLELKILEKLVYEVDTEKLSPFGPASRESRASA
ncbi:MAG: exosortase [Planctomycetes bacterium]|nr:exosortase [Planctomycetota bacterium]